jgi:hypothetical protein
MRLRVRTAREKERERNKRDLFDIMTEIAIAKQALYGTKRGDRRDEGDKTKKHAQESSSARG